MLHAGCDIGFTILAAKVWLATGPPESLPTTLLLFNPVRIILLIMWVYICMYSILRIEHSPLVQQRYKPIANMFALLIGPFLLFVLLVADTVKKLQTGQMDSFEILWVLGGIFKKARGRFRADTENDILLLDSSGRSFHEVYGNQVRDRDESREILDLTESVVLGAIRQKASDILIDPKSEGVYTVRYRIDGVLSITNQIETGTCAAVINSIKAVSSMDIAEKRRPQDGAFMARIPQGSVFFRVASAGVLGGEKLSIRVLDQSAGFLRLDDLGLSGKAYEQISNAVRQASGMLIVCGPTGSGKTTSLYGMLGTIDFYTRNVVTIEDPIEHVLPQASQIEVNVKADITFANALRSILRQDPDVICVGEIRDEETAGMALQAAQTGHLVLATLHSSSNMAVLVRLMDLGVKPLLLASSLSVIVSQRLVRKLCDNCKKPAQLKPEQIEDFEKKGINHKAIMQATGCRQCRETGYSGRTGIFDVFYLDDQIKAKLVSNELSLGDMKRRGDEKGRSVLRKEGLKNVLAGITTIEEVRRVTSNLG